MVTDYKYFKKKLETEKELLEKELEKVGRRNPDNLSDWEPTPPEDRDISQADENTVADSIEGYEDNAAILETLEARYNDILSGLDKIKHGTYGRCQICGEEIEVERLEANPSARTCKQHMNTK
ncbi:MAG: TraR/DksA C4-type zinc finger protein [Candidatus Zambryskibacteria bacterium]|nr:TraR/DksA C4-type zinc finger protein [Candidatus Zambryskibacteria bacterium]